MSANRKKGSLRLFLRDKRHPFIFQFKISCSAALPPKPSCKSIVDVGFILDSSGSLRNDYQNEKDFLKTLAAGFGIGPDASKAGVITFSYFSEHR